VESARNIMCVGQEGRSVFRVCVVTSLVSVTVYTLVKT
jgi:hypothetical protein